LNAIEYEFGEKGFEKQQTASKRYTYLFGKGQKQELHNNDLSCLINNPP
jgi:hypothetical protein